MPASEDVPFELKNYASPKTMVVGVADRRTGADTLLILSGTVILPAHIARHSGEVKIQRKRVRFLLPQAPRVLTAAAQIRGMQVVTGVASFHYEGPGDRTFAIDQSLIDWADDARELRVAVDTACQGAGAAIDRITYNAYVLAQTG